MFSCRAHRLTLAVILAVACCIRFWNIEARSIWFDEAFSIELAMNCSVLELLDRTGRDVHPPFYYLLLKGWMYASPRTELGQRALSALLGVLGVTLLYSFTLKCARLSRVFRVSTHSNWIAATAASLLAANAQHIYWSRETRMYTLGVVLALSSTWLLLQSLTYRSRIAAMVYPFAAGLLMLTHNYGLFTVAAQIVSICWYGMFFQPELSVAMKLKRTLSQLRPAAWAFWIYLPWVPVLLQQRARVSQEFWIQPLGWKTIPNVIYEHVFPWNDLEIVTDRSLVDAGGALLSLAACVCVFFFSATPSVL